MRTLAPLVLLSSAAALTGCDPFANLPNDGYRTLDGPLWDARSVVAASDGIYVRLPEAGRLVRVTDDGSHAAVDLDGARPMRLIPTPNADQVLVFGRWPVCDDPDPKVTTVDDCDEDDLSTDSELAIVENGQRIGAVQLPAHLNALAFAPDGATAVAYLDFQEGADIEIDGIVDLTEVVFVPLAGGDPVSVSIGFSPSNILFADDGSRAVIMSRSKVVVVDLGTYEVQAEYPLALDADQEVDPQDAVLTPDGSTALVSVVGSTLLYKLDLENDAIDIEDLDAVPSDLAVAASTDETLVAYAGSAKVDVLRHDVDELDDPIELDDPVTGIVVTDTTAVLYNDVASTYDVYALDLESQALTEYRVANPVDRLEVSPGGLYAVATLRPESSYGGGLDEYQDRNWGLGVADLSDDEMVSLVLEAPPVGMALVEGATTTHALLLLQGINTVLQVDLANPSQPVALELPAPPRSIGDLPDGRFFITHEAGSGMISFLDPESDPPMLTSASGFAMVGLFDENDTLPRRGTGGDQ